MSHIPFGVRGDPVELRPNDHPTMPKVVVRDPLGNIVEETYFNASEGLIVAMDNYPKVSQIAIVPPNGSKSILLPGA
jgi:hypothetical protein